MTLERKVVALVSCVSAKRAQAAPAGDLYTSALFEKARRYAMNNAKSWYILSAKHGLLEPKTVVAPYELTLNSMPTKGRREWAKKVSDQLVPIVDAGDTVLFLAGARYREGVQESLRERDVHVVVPMAGMRIGEQLAWLTRENAR